MVFKKKFVTKEFRIYKPELSKVYLATDKYYYDTPKLDLESGSIFLRLDKEFNLTNVIVELSYRDLVLLND